MQGFDDESGEPKVPITMESWKKKLPKDYFGRYTFLEMMPYLTKTFKPYD